MPDNKSITQLIEELNRYEDDNSNKKITDKTTNRTKTQEELSQQKINSLQEILDNDGHITSDKVANALDSKSTTLDPTDIESLPVVSSAMTDVEMTDIRADRQSNADKIGNGLANMGAQAITGAAETMINPIVGTAAMLTGGSYYDNTFTQSLDKFTETVKKDMPIYYSSAQEKMMEDQNFLQQMIPGSGVAMNFWADKVLGGIGYTVGIAAAALGTGAIGKLLGVAAEAVEGEALLAKGITKGAEDIAKKKLANKIVTGAYLGQGEASMEARTTKNEIITNLKEDRDRGLNQYSDTEIADIAASKGNINFGINAVLNGTLNATLMKNFIGGQYADKVAINATKKDAAGLLVDATLGKYAGAKNALKQYGKGFILEGNEEMLQAVSNKALNNYTRGENHNGYMASLADMYDATTSALSSQYGTMSGLEEGFIGGLTGGLFGLKGAKGDRETREANTQKLINFYNADPGFAAGIVNNISNTARTFSLSEKANKALNKNDRFDYENSKHEALVSYISNAMDNNALPVLKETIESLGNVGDEEFRKAFDYKSNYQFKPGEKAQIVDKTLSKIKAIEKRKELIDEALPYVANKKATKEQQVIEYIANSNLKSALLFTDSAINNVDERIGKLINKDIANIAPDFASALMLNDLEAIKAIKGMLSPLALTQIKSYEKDVNKLREHKQKLIDAQKKLLTKEAKDAAVNDASKVQNAIKKTITDNAKPTEKELADDAQQAANKADNLKVQINTLADKIAEGHGQSDLQLTDVEKELKANHAELLNARLAELENNKTDKKEGVKTGTYPSNNLINKGIKLGFSKENIVDMSSKERDAIASATSKNDVKDLLDKYVKTTSITNIEAKKADIERRRQEELNKENYRTTISSKLYKAEDGTLYKVEKQANGQSKISETNEKGQTVSIVGTYDNSVPFENIIDGGLKEIKDLPFTNKIVDKINTKYDAELATLEGEVSEQDVNDLLNTEDTEVVEVITNENPIPDDELNGKTPVLNIYENFASTILRTAGLHFNDIKENGKKVGEQITSKIDQQRWFKFLQNSIPAGYKLMFVTAKNNPNLWNKLVTEAKYAAGTAEAKDGIFAVIVNADNVPIISDINGVEIIEGANEIKKSIPNFDSSGKLKGTPTSGWVFTTIYSPTIVNSKEDAGLSATRIAQQLNSRSLTPITKDSPEVQEVIKEEVRKLVAVRKAILEAKVGDKYVVSYSEITSHSPGKIIRDFAKPGPVAERINTLNNIDLEVAKTSDEGGTATLTKANKRVVDNGKLYAIDKTNGRVERLNARFINQDEIDLAYQLIYNITNKIKVATEKNRKNILEDLIYIGGKLKNSGLNISIDYKTMTVKVGSKEFTGKNLDDKVNSDLLRKVLAGRLIQVNSKYRIDAPFTEYKVNNGTITVAKEWSSYKEYLLNGTNRQAPFNTSVASNKGTELKSKNPYLVYSENITLHSVKAEATEATNVESSLSELVIHEEPENKVKDLEQLLQEQAEEEEVQDLSSLLSVKPIETTENGKIDEFTKEEEGGNINIPLERKAVKEVIDYKKQDLAKELGWFTKAFPNIPLKLVKTLIDGHAFGQFVDSGVKLYTGAETGTIYHEAFHVTTQIYLDQKQIAKIYKEARERLKLPNATDLEIEEILAEEFREYVLSGGTKIFNKEPYKASYFRRLLNLIKSLFGLKTSGEIERVYEAIYTGKYAKANTVNNNQFRTLLNRESKSKKKITKIIEQASPLNGDYAFDKDVLDGIQFYFYELLKTNSFSVNDIAKYKDVKSLLLTGTKADGTRVAKVNNVKTIINNKAVEFQEEYNKDTTKEYLKDLLANYKYILDNFDKVVERFDTRISAISKYATEKSKGEEFNIDNIVDIISVDEQEEVSEKEDKKAGEMYSEANKTSTKETMFATTKFLISSLPKLDSKGKNVPNNLAFPTLVNFNETYGVLLHQLAGLNNIEDMYAKIKELAVRNPTLNVLLDRLKDYDDVLTEEQFLTQKQFQQDFAKTKNESYITIVENGKIFTTSANKNALTDKIKTQWDAKTKTASKYIKKITTGYTVNMAAIKEDNLMAVGNEVQFLNAIGIKLNQGVIDKFANTELFNTAVKYIRENANIQQAKNLPLNLFDKESKVKGRVDYLLGLEAEFSNDVVELSFVSAEGKTIYQISLNNMLTKVANTMNQATTLDNLYKALPHLNTSGTRNSIWLKTMFDKNGNRRAVDNVPINIEVALLDGLKNNDTEEGTKTTALSGYDKIILDLNNLLKTGLNPYIRASDKSTEHAFRLSQYVSTSTAKKVLPITLEDLADSFDNKTLLEIFRGYLKDELRVIREFNIKNAGKNIDKYNKVGNQFRLFDGILTPGVKERLLKSDLVNKKELTLEESNLLLSSFQKDINADIITFFERYFTETSNLFNEYGILSTVTETEEETVKSGLDIDLNKHSKDSLIRTFIVNNLINNIEQTKLFIGDLGFYSDLFKRTSAFTGTKEFAANDPSTIRQLNKLYETNPRSDGKKASENLDVVVYEDVKFRSNYMSNYIKTLVEGGISEERASEILHSYSEMEVADAQGLITLDAYREMRLRTGLWTVAQSKAYKKAIKGEILTAQEMAYFNVEKSQYAGPQVFEEGDPNSNLFVPAFHKFSLLPIFPQLVKGTNMQKVYNKMKADKIDYAIFRSGSKVGTLVDENNKANLFYTNSSNGEITTKDTMIQQIPWSYLGTQVRIDPKIKDKLTFGTQFRKLILSNIFDAGITSEKNSILVKEYNQIIKGLTYKGKRELMKEFGFEVEGEGNIVGKDLATLVNALKEASIDRSLPDNLTDALQVAEMEGRYMLKYPVDSLVNKDKIENMLMALVNARIIRQKVNGDALIQASITGFEKIGERKELDDTLPFYQMLDKNGKSTTKRADAVRVSKAGCRIPANGQYADLLARYESLDALNADVRAFHEGKPTKIKEEWISLVGYRIPTQGLNSIENLTIMEFLPPESGSLIMLPSEIVAKSGGDFDVDKLNVIKPHLNFKAENDNDVYGADMSAKRSNNYSYIKSNDLINRLLEISNEILKDPDNFIGLITPTATTRLSENVEGKEDVPGKRSMRKLRGQPLKPVLKDKTQQLKYKHVLEQFIYFLSGKTGVGIGAVHNTHHILSQLGGLKLGKEFTNEFFIKPKSIDNNGNISIGEILNNSGDKISDILSEFINAYVDIAKDPFIFDLNGGTDSAGVYFLLIRTGADFNTIVRFMNQPIITEFARLKALNKSVTKTKVKDETLLKELEDSYREVFLSIGGTDEDLTKSKYNTISTEDNPTLETFISRGYKKGEYQNPTKLIEILNDKTVSEKDKETQRILLKQYFRAQIQFINNYSTYNKISKMLSETMQASNHDTAGLGKNLQAVKDKKKAIKDLQNKNKLAKLKQLRIDEWLKQNPDKKLKDAPERMSLEDYPIIPNWENAVNDTFVKSMNQNGLAINMYKDMFITHSDENIDNILTDLLNSMKKGKDDTRSKLDALLRNDFIQYLVQNYYEADGKTLTKMRDDLFKGDNSLAKRMLAIRNNPTPTPQEEALLNNLFFKELLPVMAQAQLGAIGNTDNLKMFTKRFDTLSSNIFTQEFRKIKDISPTLYNDIIRLGIMQSGLNNSPITFVGLIPFEEHGDIVINAIENFYKKNGVLELSKFEQLFYRNNWKGLLPKNRDVRYGKFGTRVFKPTGMQAMPILGNGMFGKNYDLNNWEYEVKETKFNTQPQAPASTSVKEGVEEEFTSTDLEDLENTNEVKGIEISSNTKGLAAALTNPTELAKSKGNLEQSYPVNFRGKTYKDAEAAYQALKSTATKDEGPNSTYNLMVDIIKAKLEQHPRLVSEITKQGGSAWILSSTHQPTKQNSVWETGGKNWFIKALNDAYISRIPKNPFADTMMDPDEEDDNYMQSNLTNDEIQALKENNNDTFEDNSDIVCPI